MDISDKVRSSLKGSTMLYILAILLPPLAVLICGKPFQFLLNIVLCLVLWIPGVIHAILVVHDRNADKRAQRIIKAVQGSGK
jgi:uncharacterized membrane protein YqaE (UPF0057 family)